MGLTYQELLTGIESVVERKFSEKIDQFSSEISNLKQTNSDLIKINKALIEQNKNLRAFSNVASGDNVEFDAQATGAQPLDADKEMPLPSDIRIHFDVLIVSDSIYRHVGIECPKENDLKNTSVISEFNVGSLAIMKIVCPGARCDRLLSEVAVFSSSHCFDHIIVHAGANYIPNPTKQRVTLPPIVTAGEICDFLDSMGNLFESRISFSCIIPQRNIEVLNMANFINDRVSLHCSEYGYGLIQCLRFKRFKGRLDLSIFARDGVHLSRIGVKALYDSVTSPLKYEHKYMACFF